MSGRGGYVLKFISGKYQGGEFPLEMESEIVIGRSSELDMVLVEDMVSRRHARITSFGGELGIEDFGSTNGTFVNGERISKAKLKEGDRILVGTNIIKLVHRDSIERDATGPVGGGGMGMIGDSSRPTAPPGAAGRQNTSHTMTGVISGLIDEVPLPDLLQLFSTSKRSGMLLILCGDDTGKVYLRQGRVFYATINDDPNLSPYKAFYRMMAWKTGQFSLEHLPPDAAFDEEINESIEGLMMEGMRQLDELHNLGGDVPDMQAYLVVNKPLTPKLRDLSPEQLDIFQLILNDSRVSAVLNRSEGTDIETMRGILHLVRNEFLRVS